MATKRMHISRYSIILLIFLSCIGAVSAATITVGDSGQDHTTIRAAVTAASAGDTILVSDGTYTENVAVNKAVTIISENGTASTLVRSANNRHVFSISSDNVTLSGFNCTGAVSTYYAGIYVSSASYCNISDNRLNGNFYGINLESSSNNTLTNNTASYNNQYGIELDDSSNNILNDNTVSPNNDAGIMLRSDSNYNTLTNNTASPNNRYGIILKSDSNYNTLTNNSASSNTQYGIYLDSASNNILTRNTASSNTETGIYFYFSSNNTMVNNTMSSNLYNFGVIGGPLQQFVHNIDLSNLVDGKPIYYWTNRSDAQIPSDAGAVYVINSTNITVRDLEIANSYSGVRLAYTNLSTIQNITVSDNYYGVNLYQSSSNTLDNINASSNGHYGIYLLGSSNTLTNNTANSNGNYGISLSGSSNTLINSTANSNGRYGIYLLGSSNSNLTSNNASSNELSGIYFVSSSNVRSTEDHAIGNGDYDFYASNSDGIAVEGLVLTDNSSQVSFVTDTSATGVSGNETSSHELAGKTNVNGYINIARTGSMNFSFMYDDSGMSSSSESSVALFRLNGSEWIEVPNSSLNTTGNYVSANLTEFGTFGIFTGGVSSSSSSPSVSSSSSTSSSSDSVATRTRSQGTVTDMPTNEDGEVKGDTVAKSSDTKTTLTLYKGTTATDPSGNPVNKIIVTVPASLPADTPEEVIESGLYYDFGPSGTSFNKEVLITIDFDPEEFEGKAPTIYTYTAEGGWEALETSIDWENGVATAKINHFSMYALFGTDAEEVEDIAVETSEVNTNSPVEEETATEDDSNSGYLYWITGIGIVLMLGIVVRKKQKGDGGL